MIKHKLQSDGFNTVELLVSILVLAVLATSINSIYLSHMVQSQKTRNLSLINSFVENKVESLRSMGFLAVNEGSYDISNELSSELYPPKTASMQISSQTSGLKKVVINITYNDQGTAQTFEYTTFIGELGVGQY